MGSDKFDIFAGSTNKGEMVLFYFVYLLCLNYSCLDLICHCTYNKVSFFINIEKLQQNGKYVNSTKQSTLEKTILRPLIKLVKWTQLRLFVQEFISYLQRHRLAYFNSFPLLFLAIHISIFYLRYLERVIFVKWVWKWQFQNL